ncbi:uncharacterized protein Z519_02932 [Cladophialophora bantiana CBS 173.52]|uniref:Uncharacterized protein n=1 Tax=Cladophialophora bantiana (strain ATCC 10958 / CBS 173.52 / CDC B-1940 / NIH 8579) TaxID=1442370 RepID=A0A0D2HQY5_CLAB1|nr:uncharacterized protein Z519_02932 [Cladophialophora bantiana CBS 173.52]KIW95868.1 hypothetical protein Z519_02932 [Cladophialophora bantiana CBS 173.52]
MYQLIWTPRAFDTTIVAATVVQVINTDLDTTKTSTVFNKLPAGYTIPTNTNAKGTQTVEVTYWSTGKMHTTDIAFPTVYNIYPDRYTWNGTLATVDAGGTTTCSVDADTVIVVDFPGTQPSTFTTPTNSYGPDPGGLLFSTMYLDGGMFQPFKSFFSTEAALQTCNTAPFIAPAVAELTARFITQTSTSYEGGSSPATTGQTKPSSNGAQQASSEASYATNTQPEPSPASETASGVSKATTVKGTSDLPSQTPSVQESTMTSLATIVTDGPSGSVTLVNTIEIVSVVVISTPDGTTPTETPTTSTTVQANKACNHRPRFWIGIAVVAANLLFVNQLR